MNQPSRHQTLSDIELEGLLEMRAERDYWKQWTWEVVRGTPQITEQQLRTALTQMPDPFPDNGIGIKERRKLVDRYIANCGGWVGFKGFLMAYPLNIIMRASPELNMPIPTPAHSLFIQMSGDRAWGYEGPPADFTMVDEREPVHNTVCARVASGMVDGVLRRVRQTVQITGQSSDWEIFNG
jgi:hypothetical protein